MNPDQALQELKRGAEEILSESDLTQKLKKSFKTGQPLVIKAGFDPSAPDIHLGHTVLIQKMAQFQRLGHTVIFLVGDFTGLVGDPSGRNKTRPQLSKDEIKKNAQTYTKQAFKILDPQRTQVRFNSEWLDKLGASDFVELVSHANVARMLERENFNKPYKEGNSIRLHEFLYPLLQAYDSVILKADVELGGRDQKFNLLLGRELMRDYGLDPQICLTVPLLEGLDGIQKMSKSLENYVGVEESPSEMYGKLMSIPDKMLRRYFDLLSSKTLEEIAGFFKKMDQGKINPKDVKSALAQEIVQRYHSRDAAVQAKAQFEKIFSKRQTPDEIPQSSYVWNGKEIWLPKLLVDLGLVTSTSEGKRLIAQGAIKIGETSMKSEHFLPRGESAFVIQCGKRKFTRVLLE